MATTDDGQQRRAAPGGRPAAFLGGQPAGSSTFGRLRPAGFHRADSGGSCPPQLARLAVWTDSVDLAAEFVRIERRRGGRDDPARPAEDERAERPIAGRARGGCRLRLAAGRYPRRRPLRRPERSSRRAPTSKRWTTCRPGRWPPKPCACRTPSGAGPHSQADHCRRHRLRARRRARAGADRRLSRPRRHRSGRPAGNPARRHPRRRRHAAARAPDRPGEGQGARSSRAVMCARTKRSRSGSPTGSCLPTTVYDEAMRWARAVRRGSGGRAGRGQDSRSTTGWRWALPRGFGWNPPCSPGFSAPTTGRLGMRSFLEHGPGHATFAGS